MNEIMKLLYDVAKIAGVSIHDDQLIFIDRGCPHQPKPLPEDKMSIYMFKYGNEFIKIGKVGLKSNARFQSQHYNPNSSLSNLAKSILADDNISVKENNVGEWIKNNVQRYDVLIDQSLGVFVLNLFEATLHCKFKPKYEGFSSQKM